MCFKFSLRRFLKFCVPKARFQEYRIFRSGICLMTYSEKTCFRAVRPAGWSKTFLGQNQPFWLIHPVIYCFRLLPFSWKRSFCKRIFENYLDHHNDDFDLCFTVQFSKFSCRCLRDSLFILSQAFRFVNNFFLHLFYLFLHQIDVFDFLSTIQYE